jgi:predicted GIY-YIG superfamily endonuclease
MSWFVYIAQAQTGRFYTGITTDPKVRILKHNAGTGSAMARQQGPFALRYVSNALESQSAARSREVQIKGWSKAKKLKLIRGEWE